MNEVKEILAPSPVQPLNGQGVLRIPRLEGRKNKENSELKIGTLNIGTMTGKGRELADLMERRHMDILCVQETRWKGNKAQEIGNGYKLFYSAADQRGRNGVGIIIRPCHKENIINVERKNDRMMAMKLIVGETIINVINIYAPQERCEQEIKDRFWQELDGMLTDIPEDERTVVAGDFNGHVGQRNAGFERVHGGYGNGVRNSEGEKLIDFAVAGDLAILNTFYCKRDYSTYESGGQESQIDYILYRRGYMKEVKNCKVIKGEGVAKQHHLVIAELTIKRGKKGKRKTTPKIRWWKMKDEVMKNNFCQRVLDEIELKDDVDDWWQHNAEVILRQGNEIFGKTSGKGPPNDKETWWWNEEVEKCIKKKKEAKKKYYADRNQNNRDILRRANKAAKKAVAVARAKASEEMYEELETIEGQKKVYRIAKARDRKSKDFTHIKHMKDERGNVLYNDNEIKDRWKNYYEKLLNEENPRIPSGDGLPSEGPTTDISRAEVVQAMRSTKSNKAVGPDSIPIEVWKSLGEDGIDIVWDLMRKIYHQEKMPSQWRKSSIIPIYKGKGDIQDCSNYRGIKLISHTMKLWERIIGARLESETEVADNQFGFIKGRQTSDAIFALKQVMEKYREKEKGLYVAFIDIEKAYDRVPRSEVWRCMREKGVTEKYVRLVQDMYDGAESNVNSCIGPTEQFTIRVGLHQGSALSPYLFDLIMDVISEGVRGNAPWDMLFADDIVLVCKTKAELRRQLSRWKNALEEKGFKISRTKTEYLQFNDQDDEEGMTMDNEIIKRVQAFKYLGTHVSEDGELDIEVNHRVQSGWNAFRRLSGILCDRKVNVKLKGKVYKTAVRPAMMYSCETWATKKKHERKMNVAEMKMLRWMCGVTRKDRIRNEKIRGTVKVGEISKKMQERRLNWYGHVMRRDDNYVGRRVLAMEVPGKRKRGGPKLRWKDRIKADMIEKNLIEHQVMNRNEWKRLAKNSDPI